MDWRSVQLASHRRVLAVAHSNLAIRWSRPAGRHCCPVFRVFRTSRRCVPIPGNRFDPICDDGVVLRASGAWTRHSGRCGIGWPRWLLSMDIGPHRVHRGDQPCPDQEDDQTSEHPSQQIILLAPNCTSGRGLDYATFVDTYAPNTLGAVF